jgi:uncharacterized protein with HEPN domain
MVQDAIIRRLEVIGEAVKHIPEPLRAAHPEVACRQAAGTRDVLIHDCFGVDMELTWVVVEREFPRLQAQISAILRQLG